MSPTCEMIVFHLLTPSIFDFVPHLNGLGPLSLNFHQPYLFSLVDQHNTSSTFDRKDSVDSRLLSLRANEIR